MQKLVTVYLDNMAYAKGKILMGFADKHGLMEEHLHDYLRDGWIVKSIHGFGSSGENMMARGWIVALLEK